MTAVLRRSVHVVEFAFLFVATVVGVGSLALFGLLFLTDWQALTFIANHQEFAWAGLFVLLAFLLRGGMVRRKTPQLASMILGSAVGVALGVGMFALIVTTGQH